MKMLPGFQRNRHRKGVFAASSLLLLLATQTIAQSGRRATKPPAQPPVNTPQTDAETRPKSSSRELKNKVSVVVAREPSSKHLLSEDTILNHFRDHLGAFKNVTITSLGDVKRDTAVKYAKGASDSIFVLVQFDVDEFQNGTIILNSPDLDIRVLVFEPKTGKKKFEGKVYYKAVGGPMLKRDNWPNGIPIRITTEAVGIEAAEQVYDWLIVEDTRRK
ncbi:MAG TPA: hypothetical protein VJ656_04235 [Pyrinomonadaceae bacterium]|nr:hypothetical protein [Pyrinomonadaceae bacterium]